MPQLVTVSSVENMDELKTMINDLFEKGLYAEITQAIGMHSTLMDPEHMIDDQDHLYRLVLNLLKKKLGRENPKQYSLWLVAFPSLLNRIVEQGQTMSDPAAAQNTLASRIAAFGPFTSLDEFYFWALDDRRLTLEQIVRYVQKTVELQRT